MKILKQEVFTKTVWTVNTGGLFAKTITMEVVRNAQGDVVEAPIFRYENGTLCEHIPTVDAIRKYITGTQGRV